MLDIANDPYPLNRWLSRHPVTVRQLERDLTKLLHIVCDRMHPGRTLRATNLIESRFVEVPMRREFSGAFTPL